MTVYVLGLAALEDSWPDLMVIDFAMPGMNVAVAQGDARRAATIRDVGFYVHMQHDPARTGADRAVGPIAAPLSSNAAGRVVASPSRGSSVRKL